jgi:hypothetical protein
LQDFFSQAYWVLKVALLRLEKRFEFGLNAKTSTAAMKVERRIIFFKFPMKL